jgi:hypothetical protein
VQGKRRLSPSKATWCVGQYVDTTYENSCARYVVWERKFEKESDIDPMYKTLGDIDEARFAARLVRDGTKFAREVEFTHPIGGTSITIEGRYDFRLDLASGPVMVEKKSITSANRLREIITKGQIDQKQLAQLVSYMAIHKIPKGQLVCTFWKWDDSIDALQVGAERTFDVTITPHGDITVDGEPFPRHVRDLQMWYQIVAKGMENSETKLPDRPRAKQGWQNPCRSCPLADACTRYDSHHNVAQFWQETKELEPRPGKPAEIIAPKAKKGKKNEQDSIPSSSDTIHDSGRISNSADKDVWELD